MFPWRYFSDAVNISISRLWVKQIILYMSSFYQLKALRKKELGPPKRKERLPLDLASTVARISRLLVCPVDFRVPSPNKCMSQFLKTSSPTLLLSTYMHVNIHTRVLFIWRILPYCETLAFFISFPSSKLLPSKKK